MAGALVELPLFPLETVLFPEGALQLHIFEDRYRQLVRDCVENDTNFGVVLIRSGAAEQEDAEPFMVGTVVQIRNVHTYPDGQIDIQVTGESRFRIRRFDESRPYLVGLVEPVLESKCRMDEHLKELIQEAKEGLRLLVAEILSMDESVLEIDYPEDPTNLSFKIANMLQIENIEKQRLLEIVDTEARFEQIMPILREQLANRDSIAANYQAVESPRLYRVTSEHLREWSGPN